MLKRVLTALVGIPIFLGLLYVGGVYLQIVLAVFVVLGIYELSTFFGSDIYWDYLMLAGLSLLYFTYSGVSSSLLFFWFYAQLIYYFMRVIFGNQKPFKQAWHLIAVLYIAGLFSFLWLVRFDFGFHWVLFALLVTWLTDTGAYFTGIYLGKHKLAPSISPNKTIEGALGGLVAATLVGIGYALMLGHSWMHIGLLAVLLSIVGQVGDLVESTMKREQTVKDSGKILPGHGGVLDRFDSLLFVLPVLYLILSIA